MLDKTQTLLEANFIMEKSSSVILLCFRYKRCGVTESIESQYEIFCELGELPKIIYWSQLSFRELLCLRRSPNIIFISHDLRSDLLLVLFNFINKLNFSGDYDRSLFSSLIVNI